MGRPIHPLLVKLFCGWISDAGAIVRSVDVSEANGSDQFAAPVTAQNGEIRCKVPDTQPPERFSYRHMGRLGDGTHVLITRHNTGGTGVFMQLLIVRVAEVEVRNLGRPRRPVTLLTLVDCYPLGDRDSGRIEVKPDRVVVGTSQHRKEPVVLTPGDD